MSAFSFGFGALPGFGGVGLPQTGGINPSATPSGGPVPTSTGLPSPDAPWWQQLFPFLNLGAQTYLADQAITSPRPATITYAPNGQLLATAGGGAAAVIPGAVGSIPSWIWILAILLVVVMLLRR